MKKIGLFLIVLTIISCEYQIDKEIEKSVKFQLRNFPESTLQDIYKNFFQDAFGPGHLLENTEESLNYLQIELGQMEVGKIKTKVIPLGYKNNYVRVELSLIKDGVISYNEFAKAFVESGAFFESPDIEEWIAEWNQILEVIESMGVDIPNFETDKKQLSEMLKNGDFVVHHSQAFIDAYNPHYRIIYKEIFDRELLTHLQ